jgi:hypothetical protein
VIDSIVIGDRGDEGRGGAVLVAGGDHEVAGRGGAQAGGLGGVLGLHEVAGAVEGGEHAERVLRAEGAVVAGLSCVSCSKARHCGASAGSRLDGGALAVAATGGDEALVGVVPGADAGDHGEAGEAALAGDRVEHEEDVLVDSVERAVGDVDRLEREHRDAGARLELGEASNTVM